MPERGKPTCLLPSQVEDFGLIAFQGHLFECQHNLSMTIVVALVHDSQGQGILSYLKFITSKEQTWTANRHRHKSLIGFHHRLPKTYHSVPRQLKLACSEVPALMLHELCPGFLKLTIFEDINIFLLDPEARPTCTADLFPSHALHGGEPFHHQRKFYDSFTVTKACVHDREVVSISTLGNTVHTEGIVVELGFDGHGKHPSGRGSVVHALFGAFGRHVADLQPHLRQDELGLIPFIIVAPGKTGKQSSSSFKFGTHLQCSHTHARLLYKQFVRGHGAPKFRRDFATSH
mmetsp:Transcript_18362/g.49365  ORF Transcript_18362/g.49365 Transcript_18362/m.49365 type:complete len:289 (+) Transcript_18362:1055-1921(+)